MFSKSKLRWIYCWWITDLSVSKTPNAIWLHRIKFEHSSSGITQIHLKSLEFSGEGGVNANLCKGFHGSYKIGDIRSKCVDAWSLWLRFNIKFK